MPHTTILIVEDNPDDYELTIRSFEEVRLRNPVKWCRTGQEALDYLKREGNYAQRPSDGLPSLILLDLNMPGIDGKKVLAIVKQDPALAAIPVIILSTSGESRNVKQCYELGASTYIQKPIDFDGLVKAVSRMKDYWFSVALLPNGTEH
jgi:CheY-like chemotaxis protein